MFGSIFCDYKENFLTLLEFLRQFFVSGVETVSVEIYFLWTEAELTDWQQFLESQVICTDLNKGIFCKSAGLNMFLYILCWENNI